jgi:hypothetical protein
MEWGRERQPCRPACEASTHLDRETVVRLTPASVAEGHKLHLGDRLEGLPRLLAADDHLNSRRIDEHR